MAGIPENGGAGTGGKPSFGFNLSIYRKYFKI
jgi:hypothetical protein